MHSSVSCFSVQQSGSHWVSICPCWLIIFGGNFGESLTLSELLLILLLLSFVQCSVSWENPDAFWESSGHGCTIRTISWLSWVVFILLCCVRIELCVLKSLTCQRCTETIPSVEWQSKQQLQFPLPFLKKWELNCFSVKGVTCASAVAFPGGWGQDSGSLWLSPHTCLCLVPGT